MEPNVTSETQAPIEKEPTQQASVHKLNCVVKDPTEMTVGQNIQLDCDQNPSVLNTKTNDNLRLGNEQYKYVIVPRSLHVDEKGLHIVVTSYVPGSHQLKDIELMYGSEKLIINDILLSVKSVLPSQTEEKPKPYPMQTASLSWPVSFTVAILGVFIFAVLMIVIRISRNIKFKTFETEINDYDVALSAEQQIYKTLRKLDINHGQVKDVQTALLVYLSRHLRINFVKHDLNVALNLFKKKYPLQGLLRQDLKIILNDLKKLSQSNQTVDKSMLKKIYELIDTVEAEL